MHRSNFFLPDRDSETQAESALHDTEYWSDPRPLISRICTLHFTELVGIIFIWGNTRPWLAGALKTVSAAVHEWCKWLQASKGYYSEVEQSNIGPFLEEMILMEAFMDIGRLLIAWAYSIIVYYSINTRTLSICWRLLVLRVTEWWLLEDWLIDWTYMAQGEQAVSLLLVSSISSSLVLDLPWDLLMKKIENPQTFLRQGLDRSVLTID